MHRKHHRGTHFGGQWVFGGVERGSGRCFVVPCPRNRRDANTLLPLITQWVSQLKKS